jgi:glycerol-3-phosphate O-acyltransferase
VLHLFALPALIACLLGRNRRLDAQRMEAGGGRHLPLLRAELFLRWLTRRRCRQRPPIVRVLLARGCCARPRTGRYAAPEPISQEFAELRLLGETIRPPSNVTS